MADEVTVELDTEKLFAAITRRFGSLTAEPVRRGMRSVAEAWMTEAKRRTPVDTGALRASGFVTGPDVDGRDVTVRLAFGGPAAPYAAVVHEDLTARHTVGQAKYLESVVAERKGRFAREVFGVATR